MEQKHLQKAVRLHATITAVWSGKSLRPCIRKMGFAFPFTWYSGIGFGNNGLRGNVLRLNMGNPYNWQSRKAVPGRSGVLHQGNGDIPRHGLRPLRWFFRQ